MDLIDSAKAKLRPSRTSGTVLSTGEEKLGANEEVIEGAFEGVKRFVLDRVAPRLVSMRA
jgi:hypothetical protein